MWLVEWTMDLLMIVFSGILYDLAGSVLMIVDFVQEMFRKLAGMGELWIGNKVTTNVDPAIAIMSSEVVLQVLLALSIVAVAMVIIATIIQIIRTEFSTEGSKNTKGQIFGKALRALMMFFVVPVVCMGGVILSNTMLRVIDTATAGPVQTTMGAQLAVSSLESCFKEGKTDSQKQEIRNKLLTRSEDYTRSKVVKQYYELKDCNFVVLIGGSLMALWILVNASFGLVMRMYYLAIYFIISPTMVGLMPLTEAPFSKWRTKFIGQVLGAYGTVVTLNLMFQLMPVVNNINLFAPGSYANEIAHILFTLTALFMMKDLPKKLADLIGAEDASEGGAGMAKQVGGAAMKIGMAATGGVAGLAMKGVGAAAGGLAKATGGKASKVFGAIGNSAGGIGNKLTQNAKGITGGALNKVVGAATFGAVKGPFSAETDYDKAQKAKKEKQDARDEAIENGTAGLGAYVSKHGAGVVKKGVSSAVGGVVGGVTAGVAGIGGAIIGAGKRRNIDKQMEEIASHAQNRNFTAQEQAQMDALQAQRDATEGMGKRAAGATFGGIFKAAGATGNAIGAGLGAVADGGTGVIKKVGEARLEAASGSIAIDSVKGQMAASYKAVGAAVSDTAINGIGKSLNDGDALGASAGLSEMINALNSIAEKSEEQKDLLSKLTTMKAQIDGSAGDADKLKALASTKTFGQLAGDAQTVQQQANNSYNITSNFKVDGAGSIESKLEEMAKQISSTTKQDTSKLKSELLKTVKAELEKMKEEKKKK